MILKRESPAHMPEVNDLCEWLLFTFSTEKYLGLPITGSPGVQPGVMHLVTEVIPPSLTCTQWISTTVPYH